ncbi:MAG TPA: TrmB family transcriptional regulator sugar-binding domain-containing protein, partial [Candidatus Acidoferrales bacterium]|nr:TrmB family transcriptional regulator sugar-binding domain-containing protein [Candidatus Acidoferrales bacterium]
LNSKQETCLKIESKESKSLDTVVDIFSNFWESADELDLLEPKSKVEEDLKMLRTDEAFSKSLQNLIESASTELLVGIPKGTPRDIKDTIMTEVEKRAKQVSIRMILFVDSNDLGRQELLRAIDAYHSDLLQNMQFIIKDRQEILVSLRLAPSDGGVRMKHVWSNSKFYVESMTELLRGVWAKSETIESRITELKRTQMASGCIKELKNHLERGNWKVIVPGIISPKPDVRFEFGLLAEDTKGRKLAAEFINGGDSNNFQVITSFYGKAMNAGVESLNLISVPAMSLEEVNFAEYCNMHVIQANDMDELSSKLNNQETAQSI